MRYSELYWLCKIVKFYVLRYKYLPFFFILCNIQALHVYHIVVLYIELMAKWSDSFNGQIATFDMDVVEGLNGMSSKGRLGRNSLSVMNLENICLCTKNRIMEFGEYLTQCYPEIYDYIRHYIFNNYKHRQHMIQEAAKRRAINKGILNYYRDRVGVMGEQTNLSVVINNNKNKANKANLNFVNKRPRQKKTAAARAMEREENKKRRQRQREETAARKKDKQRRQKQEKKNKKKFKILDLLDKVGMGRVAEQYGLYVDNVIGKRDTEDERHANVQFNDYTEDAEDGDDALIAECLDYLSETDGESEIEILCE